MEEYRDSRLYMNSDKQPKKGDVVINCGQAHEVKGVSKDGHKLFIVGWPMTEYCNTGCSNLSTEKIQQLPPSEPEWFIKKFK